MSEKAIFTIFIYDKSNPYYLLYKECYESIQKYANKIKCPLITLGYNMFSHENKKILPFLNKFYIYKLLDLYNRILFIDSDIHIKDDAPDLFERAGSKLMMLDEGRMYKNKEQCEEFWTTLKNTSLNNNIKVLTPWYYNTGVIACTKEHKDLFDPNRFIYVGPYPEQDFINYRIALESIEVDALPIEYNLLLCGDLKITFNKADAFFIHYAGGSKKEYFKHYHRALYQKQKITNSIKKRLPTIINGRKK